MKYVMYKISNAGKTTKVREWSEEYADDAYHAANDLNSNSTEYTYIIKKEK